MALACWRHCQYCAPRTMQAPTLHILFDMPALNAVHSVRYPGAGLMKTLPVVRTAHNAGANAAHSVRYAGAERSASCSIRWHRPDDDTASIALRTMQAPTRCILFDMLALNAAHSVRYAGASLLPSSSSSSGTVHRAHYRG